MKKRSGFKVMMRLIGLVKPLAGYMILAILMGVVGHLCAAFITILGGYGVVKVTGISEVIALPMLFGMIGILELLEVFYAHTISPVVIALIFCAILSLFIGSYHPILGWIALAAYVTVGVLIPTVALMSSFGPCVALAGLGSTLQNTFAAGNRVLDILEENPVVEEIRGKEDVSFAGASVEQVTFGYGEENILEEVSLEIPWGAIIGIVGRSGSGKSTLLKLLMRFWEVQKGAIRIGDTNINHINTANLRKMQAYVTQETHLFHDSIRNNLRIAKWNATEEEMVVACKKASILRSLKEECENRTVVLVSHRQSTMRIADRVYSVECGRLS